MLGQVDDLLGCLLALLIAGFDAEVRKANQSDVGKRNGGAMLSMQVSRVSKDLQCCPVLLSAYLQVFRSSPGLACCLL